MAYFEVQHLQEEANVCCYFWLAVVDDGDCDFEHDDADDAEDNDDDGCCFRCR